MMSWFIGAFNIIAIMLIVRYWHQRQSESSIKQFFFTAFIFKLAAGLLLGLIYKFYYDAGDTFVFFQDATVLADVAYHAPLEYFRIIFGASAENLVYADQPRALFFVKLLSLPAIVTFKNYWISSLYLSFFSFLGTWELAKLLSKEFPDTKIYATVAFLFYPSFVFWSSGVLKEPITIGCLCLCLVIYLPYLIHHEKIKKRRLIVSVLLMIVLVQLKFYYAVVFAPLLAIGIINTYLIARHEFLKSRIYFQCGLAILLLILFYFPIAHFFPLVNFQNILVSMLRNHDWFLVNGNIPIEGYIHFSDLKPELSSFARNFPLALYSGLFRPTVFDVNNAFQILVGIENFLLLGLFITSFIKIPAIRASKNVYLIFILLLYIIILATVLSFAAPNFGTLMRYKVAFLPFFLYTTFIVNPIFSRFKSKRDI